MARLNPLYSLSDEEIRMAMRNSQGTNTWMFIPQSSFERLAVRQIEQLLEPSIQACDVRMHPHVYVAHAEGVRAGRQPS